MNPSRRTALTSCGVLGVAALLAACNADADEPAADRGATSSAGTGDSAFPVTVTHKYGSTTVGSAPKRVVCVGLCEQDSLLALGVVPVAVTAWLEAAKGEIYPWARPALGSAPLPKVLPSAKLDIEQIAALEPDLIVAIYSGITRSDYSRLSQLAPTVAPAKGYPDYGTPWSTLTQMVADAIGKHREGVALVKRVEGKLAAAQKAHPQFVGKTAIVATTYEGAYLYGPDDPRSQVQHALGFAFPAKFENVGGKSFGGSISAERAKEIDFDVVVWLASESDVRTKLGGLYEQTRAFKQGRTIYIPSSIADSKQNSTYASAFSMVTPLSIPWMLTRYVPQLVAAVDGNPATKVTVIAE